MKGGKDFNDFKFGTFVGRFLFVCFLSDGAASVAVKGLKPHWEWIALIIGQPRLYFDLSALLLST